MTLDWLQLLRHAVENSSRVKVAKELGVSRASISMLLSGKYEGKPDRMATRIVARYGDGYIRCPHLGAPLLVADCKSWRTRPQPMSSHAALKHWLACRDCPVGATLTSPPRQPKEKKDAG